MLSLCAFWTLFYEVTLPKYEMYHQDVGDRKSTNLVKKIAPKKEIDRKMNDVKVMENGNIVLSFLQTPMFDNRYQLGLLLVFEEDIPLYTLEFNYGRSFSLEFEENKMLLTRQADSNTRLYSVDGEYMGKIQKREVAFPQREIYTPDGSIYTIESRFLCDSLIKYTSNGEKKILYKSSNLMPFKKCLYYGFLVGGIISMGASILFSNRKKTESKNEDRHEKTHKKRFF